MLEKILTLYQVYNDGSELEQSYLNLLLRAKENSAKAYAPYSGFHVGAAILLDDNSVIDGSNHENAAYPMCLCAEQVAIANFHTHHTTQKIKAIAISANTKDKIISTPVPPCGACRQIVLEVAEKLQQDFEVILQGETGPIYVIPSVKSLLPIQFDASNL